MAKLPDTRKRSRPSNSKSHRAKRPAASTARRSKSTQQANAPVRAGTKQATLIDMLKKPNGATIAQMGAKTGWQPHSVRGFLAGTVKKKLGLPLISERSGAGPRRYRIPANKG